MGILVLRDKRGLRLGYQGGTRQFMFGGPPEGILIGIASAGQSKRTESISMPALRQVETNYQGRVFCPHCGRTNFASVSGVIDCISCRGSFEAIRPRYL